MDTGAGGEKDSQDEEKGNEDGCLGERQTLVPVSELRVDVTSEVDKSGGGSRTQGPSFSQVQLQQQQPQGAVVFWERFLPVRSIKVLLVENDDSTRHVVAALLRNCHYEVVDAANGLQAWKILEDLTNHIDLVLTEVVMPYLPGIPLLSKIMTHKTRKNIPVIMMSSHDSMGLVFKCLSKGAVDFLVKPIRKNELKNLWQHVWRRCHSSSGSGSESGTRTQKYVKSRNSGNADNSASDDGEKNGSNGLNIGDGSDDGSGAQSSWTKQAVEVDSSRGMSPMDQVAECADSTCAQVIISNAENSVQKGGHFSVAAGGYEQKQPDTVVEDKELVTVIPRNTEAKAENHFALTVGGSKLKSLSESYYDTTFQQVDKGSSNPAGECLSGKHQIGDKMSNPHIAGRESESTKQVVNKSDININAIDDSKQDSKQGLKRLRGDQDTCISAQGDRYVLRRSEQSAFSRYTQSSSIFKAPNGIASNSSRIDNNDHLLCPSSNGFSCNIDMVSTTNKVPARLSIKMDKTEATSTINGIHPSAFRPVTVDQRNSQQEVGIHLHGDMQMKDLCSVRGSSQDPQNQPHHDNYRQHHYHHLDNMEQQPSSNSDKLSMKKLAADATHCGSTNALHGNMDGNPRNYSLNRSASGSNQGSNGQNGSSTAVKAAAVNAESDVGQAGKSGTGSGSGDASGSGSGIRVDVAHRAAALRKFRQKKKDRCFAKKVRYHNRKKLAEQRPRVRGQFVKQTGGESSNRNADE